MPFHRTDATQMPFAKRYPLLVNKTGKEGSTWGELAKGRTMEQILGE